MLSSIFPKLGARDSTRALQSSLFQNPGGVAWAWRSRSKTGFLFSNFGWRQNNLVMIWFINTNEIILSKSFKQYTSMFTFLTTYTNFQIFSHTAFHWGLSCIWSGSSLPAACPRGWSRGRSACQQWPPCTCPVHPPTWRRALPPENNSIFV